MYPGLTTGQYILPGMSPKRTKTKTSIELGQHIKTAREAKKWDQVELAEKLGISKSAVNMWEAGTNVPDQRRQPDLCKLLGLDPIMVAALASGREWSPPELRASDHQDGFSRFAAEIVRRAGVLHLSAKALATEAGVPVALVISIFEGEEVETTERDAARLARALGCTIADLRGEQLPRRVRLGMVSITEVSVNAPSGYSGDPNAIIAHENPDLIMGEHTMPEASFREAYGVSASRIKIIAVKGTSMVPDLWPGQRVMVDIEDHAPSPPGVFVVWDGVGLVLKYVEVVHNSDPVRVRLLSKNPIFGPYECLLDEAHINGRVIGLWAKM